MATGKTATIKVLAVVNGEQITRDQKKIGRRFEHGIDHLRERLAHLVAIRFVIEMNVGSMDNL